MWDVGDDLEQPVSFYPWDAFLLQFFELLKGVSKQHHSILDKSQPGVVAKETLAGAVKETILFQKDITKEAVVAAGLPTVLVAGGLVMSRKPTSISM